MPFDKLPSWMTATVAGVNLAQLIGVAILIFVALAMRRVVQFIVAKRLRPVLSKLLPRFDANVEASAKPLSGLTMAAVFAIGLPLLAFPPRIALILQVAIRLLGVASAVWLVYRQVDLLSQTMSTRAKRTETRLDDQLVPLVRRTLKFLVVTIGGIFILQNLDVDVGSLLAGLGLGGLAFALAAKDTIANFFGSVVIFVDRPFQIGDWVKIKEIEGTVEDVGFRTTRIRTFYNSLVTVPNSLLTQNAIDNLGARKIRRMKMTFGLTYTTTPQQMQAFVEGLRAIVAAHPGTHKDAYEIHFNSFGASSLNILFYVFIDTPTWSEELKARHEMLLSILQLAHELGVQFAFPTQTLHLASTPEHPEASSAALDTSQLREQIVGYGPGGSHANPRFELTHGYGAGEHAESTDNN